VTATLFVSGTAGGGVARLVALFRARRVTVLSSTVTVGTTPVTVTVPTLTLLVLAQLEVELHIWSFLV